MFGRQGGLPQAPERSTAHQVRDALRVLEAIVGSVGKHGAGHAQLTQAPQALALIRLHHLLADVVEATAAWHKDQRLHACVCVHRGWSQGHR